MSRIRDDPNQLRGLLADTGLSIIRDVLTFLVGITIIFVIHWKLAIAAVSILPFFIISLSYFSSRIRDLSQIYFENKALVSKKLQESISGIELFKSFASEKFETIRFLNALKTAIRSNVKRTMMGYISSIITGFIGGLGPVVVIWYGMSEIIHNNLTLGELIAFNSFIGYFFGPTSRLVNIRIQS